MEMVFYFIDIYVIKKKTLRDHMEVRNSLLVMKKYFTRLPRSLVGLPTLLFLSFIVAIFVDVFFLLQ